MGFWFGNNNDNNNNNNNGGHFNVQLWIYVFRIISSASTTWYVGRCRSVLVFCSWENYLSSPRKLKLRKLKLRKLGFWEVKKFTVCCLYCNFLHKLLWLQHDYKANLSSGKFCIGKPSLKSPSECGAYWHALSAWVIIPTRVRASAGGIHLLLSNS